MTKGFQPCTLLSFLVITIVSSVHCQNATQNCFESLCIGKWTSPDLINVTIGSYINSISAFDAEGSTVRFDLYVWLKWPMCTQVDGETFRPDLSFRTENSIIKVDLNQVPTYPAPICLVDAHTGEDLVYYEVRLEGQFYQILDYKKYPLDTQTIKVSFEDNLYPRNKLLYVKDTTPSQRGYPASGINSRTDISGWNIDGFFERERSSNYGTAVFEEVYGDTEYSRYSIGAVISRGVAVYILKLLPPVIIVLAISGMVFLLDIEAMDTRIATAVGGLLTSVFLQLTMSANLPTSIDYLTLADWIFNCTYIFIMLVIIECITMRKIYYRMLLLSQFLKDEIELTNIKHSLVSMEDLEMESIAKEMETTKKKKHRVKLLLRRFEKYLFVGFCVLVAFTFIVVTLAIATKN